MRSDREFRERAGLPSPFRVYCRNGSVNVRLTTVPCLMGVSWGPLFGGGGGGRAGLLFFFLSGPFEQPRSRCRLGCLGSVSCAGGGWGRSFLWLRRGPPLVLGDPYWLSKGVSEGPGDRRGLLVGPREVFGPVPPPPLRTSLAGLGELASVLILFQRPVVSWRNAL